MSWNERILSVLVFIHYLVFFYLREFLDLLGITLGDYGYIDRTGRLLIGKSDRFSLESFSCGRAIQRDFTASGSIFEGSCFINNRGHRVSGFFQGAQPFSEGMAAVKLVDRFGFINLDGKNVVPCMYDDAESFVDGLAAVCKSGKWGFINSSGEMKIEPQFEQVMYFSEELAAVVVDGKVGFIDKNGCFVIEPVYRRSARFSCGLASVDDNDYVDKSGNVVFSTERNPDHTKFAGHNRIFNCLGPADSSSNSRSKHRIIAKKEPSLQRQTSTNWYPSTVRTFSENVAVAGRGDKIGYIDLKGTFCIDPVFDYAHPFSDERALVYVDGLFGYIDKSGEYVAKPQFERAYSFSEGFAAAKFSNGKYGYLDRDGNVAVKPRFSFASNFSDGLAQVGDRRTSM